MGVRPRQDAPDGGTQDRVLVGGVPLRRVVDVAPGHGQDMGHAEPPCEMQAGGAAGHREPAVDDIVAAPRQRLAAVPDPDGPEREHRQDRGGGPLGPAKHGRPVDRHPVAQLVRRQAGTGGGEDVDLVPLRELDRDVARRDPAAAAERRVLIVDEQKAHAKPGTPSRRHSDAGAINQPWPNGNTHRGHIVVPDARRHYGTSKLSIRCYIPQLVLSYVEYTPAGGGGRRLCGQSLL